MTTQELKPTDVWCGSDFISEEEFSRYNDWRESQGYVRITSFMTRAQHESKQSPLTTRQPEPAGEAVASVEKAISALIGVCHRDGLNRKGCATPESLAALDALRVAIAAHQPAAAPAPAVPQGEQATIAGLDAANGHLSTLLDDSVLMLKQLRQMVDELHERWSNGGKPERGEFELLDRVDDWLSCRPDSIVTAHAPALEVGLTEAERVRCLIASGCIGTVKMTYDSGPYEITRTSINASRLIDAIIAALRAKGQV